MPYRFLDSENFEQKLILTLERIGYQFISKEKKHREEIMKFKRIWNDLDILLINWERTFVFDGMDEQDSQVVISINNEIGIIDIDKLLRSKLEIKLNEEVYNNIIEIVKTHT